MVNEAQRQMVRSLSWFLSWMPRLRSDRDWSGRVLIPTHAP